MLKVSVVLPVYNTEKQLTKCIESILNQKLSDFELLIINDASPDNSPDIIREFARKDGRITVFDLSSNMGVSYARNLGLMRARGEYICFPDSDDYLDKDMLYDLYESASGLNCEMAVCNYRLVGDDYEGGPFLNMPKHHVIEVDGSFVRDVLGERAHLGGFVSNKLFNTEFLKKSGVVFRDREEIFAEDAFFYFSLLPLLKRISVIDKPYYSYYQRSTSVMHTYKHNLPERIKRFLSDLRLSFRNLPYYNDMNYDLKIRMFTFLCDIITNEMLDKPGLRHFSKVLSDPYFRQSLKNLRYSDIKGRRRLLYFLYKSRLYCLIYLFYAYGKEKR